MNLDKARQLRPIITKALNEAIKANPQLGNLKVNLGNGHYDQTKLSMKIEFIDNDVVSRMSVDQKMVTLGLAVPTTKILFKGVSYRVVAARRTKYVVTLESDLSGKRYLIPFTACQLAQ